MKALAYIPTLAVALVAALLAGGYGNAAVTPNSASGQVSSDVEVRDPAGQRRPVDLVICLDTSGSMTALIDSARAKLWEVVNELAQADPTPRLRVGLLTYGSPKLSTAQRGWVVRQTDLTTDLDTVYARMMGMTTDGGDEYVGWVLNDAVNTMSWSEEPEALKVIFVAGNESADQASNVHDFRYVAEQARSRGIFINAIYAGNIDKGVAEHWNEVAVHGGGHYAAIDMHEGTIQLATPQDEILRQLNEELNATYLPYGRRGRAGAANQLEQDGNALRLGAQSNSSRIVAKAGALYDNAVWDLVDASRQEGFDLDQVEEAELPEAMHPMNAEERLTYLRGKQAAREAVQKKTRQVSAERETYLRAERAKRGLGGTSLDQAMRRAIRTQAAQKGFGFNNGPAEPNATKGTASPSGSADQP